MERARARARRYVLQLHLKICDRTFWSCCTLAIRLIAHIRRAYEDNLDAISQPHTYHSLNLLHIPLPQLIIILNPLNTPISNFNAIRPHEHASLRLALKVPCPARATVIFALRLVKDNTNPGKFFCMGGGYFGDGSNIRDAPTAVRLREETAPGLQFDIYEILAAIVAPHESVTSYFAPPPPSTPPLPSSARYPAPKGRSGRVCLLFSKQGR